LTAALHCPFVRRLCQQIALQALRPGGDTLRSVRDEFASKRAYAYERLQAMDLNPSWPAGAFFFWVPVWQLGLSGRAFADGLLRSKRVLVTPGDPFGPSGAGYVRVSYVSEDGRLREGLSRLAEYVSGEQAAGDPRFQSAA